MGNRACPRPIESKLHVIELSLLPPNSKGIMPAGIQRFPFEFPLPGSLPVTLTIPDRLDIFYRLTATLRKSVEEHSSPATWLDFTRLGRKNKLVATATLRLVRAIEPIPSLSNNPAAPYQRGFETIQEAPRAPEQSEIIQQGTRENDSPPEQQRSSSNLPRGRMSLDHYYATEQGEQLAQEQGSIHPSYFGQFHLGLALDEQHDRLAYSMAGRTIENYGRPVQDIPHGLRYRLSIDRTAIAIGTSVGVEVLLEPVLENVRIKSIITKISETRDYTMKVPGDYFPRGQPETRRHSETVAMALKWAYGYPVEHEESTGSDSSESAGKKKRSDPCSKLLSRKYRHHTRMWEDALAAENCRRTKWEGGEVDDGGDYYAATAAAGVEGDDYDDGGRGAPGELLNLKQLDQPIQVGEYFEGRFVMPVPTCELTLRPTMYSDSIVIRHWLDLIVTMQHKDKTFAVKLSSPVRLLDCRLVAPGDERQTLLPPPPSYDGNTTTSVPPEASDTYFWAQRMAITQDAVWGICNNCPCQVNKSSSASSSPGAARRRGKSSSSSVSSSPYSPSSYFSSSSSSSAAAAPARPPLSSLPEWGPPPCYSEN